VQKNFKILQIIISIAEVGYAPEESSIFVNYTRVVIVLGK